MKSRNWAIGENVVVNELPLCDLKATEADTEARQLVEDYAVWFANR